MKRLKAGNLPKPDPDAVYLGVYGTVMCSFGPPLAYKAWQDPALVGKTMIIAAAVGERVQRVHAGDTILGCIVLEVNDRGRAIRLGVPA